MPFDKFEGQDEYFFFFVSYPSLTTAICSMCLLNSNMTFIWTFFFPPHIFTFVHICKCSAAAPFKCKCSGLNSKGLKTAEVLVYSLTQGSPSFGLLHQPRQRLCPHRQTPANRRALWKRNAFLLRLNGCSTGDQSWGQIETIVQHQRRWRWRVTLYQTRKQAGSLKPLCQAEMPS